MERILNIKVDLECPDEAKFAIDKAAEIYKHSKKKWSAFNVNEAKSTSLSIMYDLCKEGLNIDWSPEIVDDVNGCIVVWISNPNPCSNDRKYAVCTLDKPLWNTWVGKCVALCKATDRKIPEFITDKAGECL